MPGDPIADALHELYPPAVDLTAWPVERLDELGAYAAAERGYELVEFSEQDAQHGANQPGEMDDHGADDR